VIPGRAPRLPWFSRALLVAREHPDATIPLHRLAIRAAGRQRHKDMIVVFVGGHAVGVAVGGNVLEPLPGPGINHAEDRARGHIASGEVIAVVAGVVPRLVNGTHVVDGSKDLAGGTVDDDTRRRERPAVMIGATHQDIRARAGTDTGGHATQYRETVDYDRAGGAEGIDFVNASDRDVGRGVSVA
jgi:hypothetical protein